MAFWSVAGPEPKRQYRWIIRFAGQIPDSNLSNLTYALKKCKKPAAKIKETTHAYLNHKFHYPGRLEWDAISMTFASITKPDATELVNKVLINAGYGVPQSQLAPNQLATIGKRKFAGAVGNSFDIIQLDADGNQTEKWTIYNPFFTSVSFGDLDYNAEEILEINCDVRYDWAQLSPAIEPTEPPVVIPSGPGFPSIP